MSAQKSAWRHQETKHMKRGKPANVMSLKFKVFIQLCMALLAASCSSSPVLKGDIPFQSEPISRIYVETRWDNRSGKKLNSIAKMTLSEALVRANLCRIDPGIGAFLKGTVSVSDKSGTKTRKIKFGDTVPWIEKVFDLPANCCKHEGYRPDLCSQRDKITDETLILRPRLTRLSQQGFTISMDVYHGSYKNLIGSVTCSAEEQTESDCIDRPLVSNNSSREASCIESIPYDSMAQCVSKTVEQILVDFKR